LSLCGSPPVGAAAVVVVAARLEPRVQAVVSLSSPEPVFGGLDVAAAVHQLQVPVLFVAAEDDQPFADYARTLYAQASPADKQLLVLPRGGHGTSLPKLPGVRAALTTFFRAHT